MHHDIKTGYGEVESKVRFPLPHKHDNWDTWIPVAVIGPPKVGVVNVQFLIEPNDLMNTTALGAVKKDIEYFLLELGEPKPWVYAQHHCGTMSNVYGDVHWSFFKPEGPSDLSRQKS
ncbi:MAG TPA: hypothetical protein VK638_20655 [Edaphobacter sp.]|nr:hypothetical protein [Edaphobacter sp.]